MDTQKLQELMDVLQSLFKQDAPRETPKDKKAHSISVMTIQTGKGVKLKKSKKQPTEDSVVGV